MHVVLFASPLLLFKFSLNSIINHCVTNPHQSRGSRNKTFLGSWSYSFRTRQTETKIDTTRNSFKWRAGNKYNQLPGAGLKKKRWTYHTFAIILGIIWLKQSLFKKFWTKNKFIRPEFIIQYIEIVLKGAKYRQ